MAVQAGFRGGGEQGADAVEIEELLQLCGRVLVFREQTVFTTVAAEKLTHAAIIAGMFGRPDDH